MMLWVWVAVIVFAVVMELSSPIQLVSIWAALGGIAALGLELFGVDLWIQIVVFFVITFLLVLLTRPLAKKMTNFKKEATNADMNIGKSGKVTKIVDESMGVFRVRVENDDWSAATEDKTVLPVGTSVSVKRIEGVKLIVEPMDVHAVVGAN